MPKPLALTIAVCLVLAGCQVFEKSETWETVMRVRPGDSIREPDPSASYADKLHQVLLDQGVEHIVVTYQFHYYSNHYDEALGTRTAVVYRDHADENFPWWLKDDRLASPFWLPNGDLDKQISFYAHRPVEILEKKVYPAHGANGKAAVTLFRRPVAHLRAATLQEPAPVSHIAHVKPAQVSPAKPVVAPRTAAEKPIAATPATRTAPVTRIQQPPPVAAFKPGPADAPPPPTSATPPLKSSWSAPTVIDPAAQASDPAPRDEHLEKLFRIRNGTDYDRSSTMDRRKMEQLKQSLLGKETPSDGGLERSGDAPAATGQF